MDDNSPLPSSDTSRKKACNFVKRHPFKFIILVGFIVVAARVVIWDVLDATGFCWAEKRWLSNEEKTMDVLKVVWGADGIFLDPREQGFNDPGVTVSSHYEVVQSYPNAKDILKQNPNCCVIESDTGSSTYNEGDSAIAVTIPIKYKNRNNEVKTYRYADRIRFDNCGAVTSMNSQLKW